MQLSIAIPTYVAHCECVQFGNKKFMEMVLVRAASVAEAVLQVKLDARRIKVKAIEKLGAPFTITPVA